jgi:hypothetical protein
MKTVFNHKHSCTFFNINNLKKITLLLLLFVIFTAIPRTIFSQPPGIPADNELFKMGFLDVTLLGADSTGVTISTQAIRNAVNLARDYRLVCYFPSGTYLVDDTIRCMKLAWLNPANNKWQEYNKGNLCYLLGSAKKRPVIKLVQGAARFQDPGNPLPVIWMYAMSAFDQQPECQGSTDPLCNQSNINFNQSIRSIDFDLGGNPGAMAISNAGAQGATIEDIKIQATGAFAGLHNPPGQAGGTYNIEVIGGKYGFYMKNQGITTQRQQSKFVVMSGCTFRNQETSAFHFASVMPVVIAGFHIIKDAGPINSGTNPTDGLTLVDGLVELGSGQLLNNSTERNIYMRNVYIKGANQVVTKTSGSWTVDNPAGWTRIEEYSNCVSNSQNLIEGMINQLEYKTKQENLSINAEEMALSLKFRHCWNDNTFPHFEMGDVVNVKNASMMNGQPAVGDNSTDDTEALEYAINHYEKIFLPKGTYKISRPLILAANTKIFGISRTYSGISGANIETVDNKEATTQLAFLDISGLTWKAGRNSYVRDINPGNITITGNGGGKWHAIFNTGSHLTINATTEPLRIYAANPERTSDPQFQILNAQNVEMYYVKSEAGGTVSAVATSLKISNSGNIAVHGSTGNINLSATEGKAIIDVTNSENIVITHVHQFNSSSEPWFIIKEKIGTGNEIGIAANSKLAMYRRGNPVLSVNNDILPGKLLVYPNPCQNYIKIQHGGTELKSYWIRDLQGKIILSGTLKDNENTVQLNTSPGIYIVSVSDRDRMYHSKIIQQ